MVGPTYVNLDYCFHPVANLPVVNLLRDVPATEHQETVRLLSLACGDARALLFSSSCVVGHSSLQLYDITCCDDDPAVLARNIILFALIIDGPPLSEVDEEGRCKLHQAAIWDIYHHFHLPEQSLSILQDKADDLLLASESLRSWQTSAYGAFARFMDGDSLRHVRNFWLLYADTRHLSASRMRKFEAIWRASISKIVERQKPSDAIQGVRSAGVMWPEASDTMARAFAGFWETGVVAGNCEDVARLGQEGKGRFNPTFAYSSAPMGNVAVHPGTDPLLAFHVAEVFSDPTEADDASTVDRIVQVAKSQFEHWCSSFRRLVRAGRLWLNLFCGDPLRFCHELQSKPARRLRGVRDARRYAAPWSFLPLALDGCVRSFEEGGATLHSLFDVIDTSTIVDELGALNVLAATVPLLERRVTSVLYTESIRLTSQEIFSTLSDTLCADVTTFSLLIGLAPMGHVLGYTIDEVGNEAKMLADAEKGDDQRRYRTRVPWRVPALGDSAISQESRALLHWEPTIRCTAKEIAGFVYTLYKKMFVQEDISMLTSSVARQLVAPYATARRHYIRASFVAVLRLVRLNISTSWTVVMETFLAKIDSDVGSFLGNNSQQELCMHLHLMGVWRSRALSGSPRSVVHTADGKPVPRERGNVFLDRDQLPSVTNAVLVIPRENLRIFMEPNLQSPVAPPGLHISLTQVHKGQKFENSFYSIQCGFGELMRSPNTPFSCSVQEEDDRGWLGSSDLIVHCQIPTFNLLIGPQEGMRLALVVNSTESTVHLRQQLGLRMAIFEAGFTDDRLLFVKEPPGLSSAMRSKFRLIRRSSPPEGGSSRVSVPQTVLDLTSTSQAGDLTIRVPQFKGSEQRNALERHVKIEVTQRSPCTAMLQIGHTPGQVLEYPYPIDGRGANVCVSRKCNWADVTVRISRALQPAGYSSTPFPQALTPSLTPVTWGLPRVELERQPRVTIGAGQDATWARPLVHHTFSNTERSLSEVESPTTAKIGNGKMDVKASLNIMLLSMLGLNPARHATQDFQFTLRDDAKCHILVFADCLRHDLDSGSVVVDACAVPLTPQRREALKLPLQALAASGPLDIELLEQEAAVWKHMLPAASERCRTWRHRKGCEYTTHGCPVSMSDDASPLCSCAEGQVSAGFGRDNPAWAPFTKYATRIALSPLFPVPYVEAYLAPSKGKKKLASIFPPITMPLPPAPAPVHPNLKDCAQCGASSAHLKPCSRCAKVHYCNHACQKAAWKGHKKKCLISR
ncbi:MAG: hypothetical protein M1825_003915 [Sarcosagium campestre]|nr:MAG: hypothetical protein M1825_003915 [Sarcosagium campestre]